MAFIRRVIWTTMTKFASGDAALATILSDGGAFTALSGRRYRQLDGRAAGFLPK